VKRLLAIAVLAAGCRNAPASCPDRPLLPYQVGYDHDHYDIRPTTRTADGIALDASGLRINPARVDRLFREVETCLSNAFGVPSRIDDATFTSAGCVVRTFPLPLIRSCIVVKIAGDWRLSADGRYQTLAVEAIGVHECKGHADICYYRTMNQGPFELVTTPSMWLLKDWIVRVSTGCADPWGAPKLAACAAPTTGPLDDGTGP